MEKKVVIIDFHLGNLFSVMQACDTVGISASISSVKEEIAMADALILPGVGAFSEAMKNLAGLDLITTISEKVNNGTPLFGICLGLQLLFTQSEEFETAQGLGLIDGLIHKFPPIFDNRKIRVPQISWNMIYGNDVSWTATPLQDLRNGDYMYFVHSFYVKPKENSCILTRTNYEGIEYCSAVLQKNIFATQFHPEKSSINGISIYRNWALQNNLV